MQRWIAHGLAFLLTAGSAAAQSMTEAAAKEKQRRDAVRSAEWQEFQNPGGDFKVLFPYAPMKKRELIPGMTTLMDTYMAAKDKRSYIVRVGELEPELAKRPADQTLDEVRAGLLKDAQGPYAALSAQLEDEKPISLGGRSGRQYRVRTKARNGEELVLQVKTFVAGNRILLVVAGGLAEDKDTAIADRFFASFAILR
jgi:hypothetical protein